MKRRISKILSLFLASALVLSMSTGVFAEEIYEDEAPTERFFQKLDNPGMMSEAVVTESDTSSKNEASISADKVLSENPTISDNLAAKSAVYSKTSSGTFAAIYPTSLPYNGEKIGSKKYPVTVKVYYSAKTPSENDLDALLSGNSLPGWSELKVKKVSVKAAKGATVKLDGSPLVEAKKGTYIKSIKLEDKEKNKAFQEAFKDVFKGIKKSTEKVSGNGIAVGKSTVSPFVIPVYPAYAGNDKDAIALAKKLKLNVVTLDFSKTKYKDGVPKSIKGTIGSKKVTLKPTKKADKPKGFNPSKKTTTAGTNSLKATTYLEADGNFAGNIYFTAK